MLLNFGFCLRFVYTFQVREFTEAVSGERERPVVYGGSVKAPKILADIVESVAAAIYVDMNFDLEKLWVVCISVCFSLFKKKMKGLILLSL